MPRPAKPDGERVRDIAPTGVRLPPALRDALVREAHVNGRSLSAEILNRLHGSFDNAGPLALDRGRIATAREAAPVVALALGEPQRRLLSIYNRITPEEQLALLTLLARLAR